MPIKNYTTNIDSFRSIGEIQGALASHGISQIMIDYADGCPVGISFALQTARGFFGFKLPANIEGVRCAFEKEHVRATAGQAERTAWRNIRDWVLAQMAIIDAGMVQTEEVFFPYIVDKSGTTVFDAFQQGRLLLGANEER